MVALGWTRVHRVVAVTLSYGVSCHAIDGSKKATVAVKRPVHLPMPTGLTSVGRSYPHLCVLEKGSVQQLVIEVSLHLHQLLGHSRHVSGIQPDYAAWSKVDVHVTL